MFVVTRADDKHGRRWRRLLGGARGRHSDRPAGQRTLAMTSPADAHTGGVAEALRHAATIADPYQRADAIWAVVLRLHSVGAPAAERSDEIRRRLEEGCEADGELPGADALKHYARRLTDL